MYYKIKLFSGLYSYIQPNCKMFLFKCRDDQLVDFKHALNELFS